MKLTYDQVVDELDELYVVEQYDDINALLGNSTCTQDERDILLVTWSKYRDCIVDELANEQ